MSERQFLLYAYGDGGDEVSQQGTPAPDGDDGCAQKVHPGETLWELTLSQESLSCSQIECWLRDFAYAVSPLTHLNAPTGKSFLFPN